MALVVGRLLAQLGIEDSGFSSGMNAAQSQYQRTGQSAAQMARTVEQSAAKVQSARASEQSAALRVQAAEKNLNALRKSGETDALKLAQAESKLQTALASQNQAKIRAANAARGLSAAQRQQASASQQVSSANQKAATSTNNLAASATRAKSALASIGIGLSLTAVVAGMTQAVGAARALGAQTNQLSVIFGDNAGQIKSWGSTAVDSMRMSQREAQGAAVQFATFGKAMGLSGQELVKFSTQQTKLAADLASFQGIPVADAVEAMGSAFAGETETMRKYGVLLDENTIKQAAYKNGIAEVGTQLTAQQKAQGAYFAMQEQLAHVNGDVERSNRKFGASLKTLTARLEEVQASVGQKLIPVIQPFVDLLAGPGLSAVEGFATVIGKAASAFNSLPAPVKAALAAIVAFQVAQRLLGTQMAGLQTRAAAVGQSFTGFSQRITNVQRAATLTGGSMNRLQAASVAMGRGLIGSSALLMQMQAAFLRASSSASRFPAAAGAASAAMTGMRGAATGLMGALGGPWGLAIAGATALLGMWISKKQEDAAKSEQAKNAQDEWAEALRQSGGAIDDSIRNLAAKKIAETDAYETAEKLGIAQEEVTEAVLGGRDAYDSWYATIKRARPDEDAGNFAGLTGDIEKVATAFGEGKDKAEQMSKGVGEGKVAFDSAAQSAKSMSAAMEDYKEETGGAAAQVDMLAKALKGLADDKLTLEEADQSWHDNLRDLSKTLGETTDALITQSGAIDVTSEAGSKLQDAVVDQRDAFFDVAAAAKRYTDEQQALGKMDAAQALDHVNGKLAPLRQSFIDAAIAAGKSADEAKRMADHYLGLPGQITTQLELKGVDMALARLNSLKVKGAEPVKGTYNMVDNTDAVRKRLDEIKVKYTVVDGKIVINQDDIQRVDNALRDLGIQTESLPGGYIKITDTSPENMARLEALGIKTQTLPNGTVVVNVDDSDFNAKLPEWSKPVYKQIIAQGVGFGEAAPGGGVFRGPGIAANADGSIRQRANGALDSPQIQNGSGMGRHAITPFGPVQWAEGETDWEAFIPGALSKRGRATAILKETARRFGYGLMPLASLVGSGDYTPAMRELWGLEEDSPIVDAILSARARVMADGGITAGGLKNYMRGIDGGMYAWGRWGDGWNTDCSGGQSIAAEGTKGNLNPGTGQRAGTAAFSTYLPSQGYQLGRAPAGVPAHEVGWSPEHTAGTIFDPQGGDVNVEMGGSYGDGKYGGNVGSRDGQFPNQAWKALQGDAGSGVTGVAPAATERERNIDAVVAEGKRRGKSDKEIKSAVMTVLAETNGENLDHGMDGDNAGLFQQRDSWGTREERMNPTTAAGKYFDAMDKVEGRDTMSEAELAQAIQRSSDSSGGIYAAKSAEADQLMAASMARLSGGTTNNITMGGAGVGGNVFVTGGHLDYIGKGGPASADTTPTTPAAPDAGGDAATDGSLRITSPFMRGQQPLRFQDGGTIPGTGRGDKTPLLGEPGEEIIRRDVAERPGVRRFLKKLNAGFYGEVPRYQDGGTVGFGGYADDTRDHMKPKNWRDALHLGVGAGFTGASLVTPYVAMAQSGQIDLGNLAPTIDTGSNSVDGLSQFVGDYAGQISNQLGQILQAIEKGERITVVVESDKSPSAAAMGATAAGL